MLAPHTVLRRTHSLYQEKFLTSTMSLGRIAALMCFWGAEGSCRVRYRGQENRENKAFVPLVLFYSYAGDLLACGAETKRLGTRGGIRTEWLALFSSGPCLPESELLSQVQAIVGAPINEN